MPFWAHPDRRPRVWLRHLATNCDERPWRPIATNEPPWLRSLFGKLPYIKLVYFRFCTLVRLTWKSLMIYTTLAHQAISFLHQVKELTTNIKLRRPPFFFSIGALRRQPACFPRALDVSPILKVRQPKLHNMIIMIFQQNEYVAQAYVLERFGGQLNKCVHTYFWHSFVWY